MFPLYPLELLQKNLRFWTKGPILTLLLWGCPFFLSACGETPPGFPGGREISPPELPCTVLELPLTEAQTSRGITAPILSLDLTNSPAYCNNVQDDFKAAMAWYQEKTGGGKYGRGIKEELKNFYTGDLVARTLAGIEYGERENQVILGNFKITDEKITATRWAKDGLKATLVITPGEYSLVVKDGGAGKGTRTYPGDPNEVWLVSLLFDAKAGRWKISESCATFIPVGSCPSN